MWGFLAVITAALIVGYYITKDKVGTHHFKLPAWLITVPILLAVLFTARSYSATLSQMSTDNIELQLSGMSKKDYLNYKIGDDRTNTSFAASATSAGTLAGSNLLGPFLRADAR